jgi:hypothetical protein
MTRVSLLVKLGSVTQFGAFPKLRSRMPPSREHSTRGASTRFERVYIGRPEFWVNRASDLGTDFSVHLRDELGEYCNI